MADRKNKGEKKSKIKFEYLEKIKSFYTKELFHLLL